MKSLSAKFGVIFLAMGLTLCCANVWGEDWREFTEATTGIFYFDAESVRSPSEGFVRVWIHNATQRETSLIEFDCKGESYKVLDVIEYDEALRMKNRSAQYDNPAWLKISAKSVPELLHTIVCP